MKKAIRNKFPIAILILLLAITSNTSRPEEGDDTQITVFCTNNKDGTGSCLTSSQEPVECILIPGSVVECTDKDENELACVSVHSTSAIVEISCEKAKASNQQANIVEIPRTSEELNPESAYNNKNDSSDRFEIPFEAELATPNRPRFDDTDESQSPFTDPF